MSGLLLTRPDLVALTGTVQPKRMCMWLTSRGWVFEAPARRGDIPKVSRAYHDAKLSGAQPTGRRPALDLSFMLNP